LDFEVFQERVGGFMRLRELMIGEGKIKDYFNEVLEFSLKM
jgi:hypothetical protein